MKLKVKLIDLHGNKVKLIDLHGNEALINEPLTLEVPDSLVGIQIDWPSKTAYYILDPELEGNDGNGD